MRSSLSRVRFLIEILSASMNESTSFSINHSGNHSRSNNLNTLPSLDERRAGQHWRNVSRFCGRDLWQILGAADSPSRAWAAHLRPGSAGHGTVDGTRWESLYPSPARCLTGLGPNPQQALAITVTVTLTPNRSFIANTGATFARSAGKLSQLLTVHCRQNSPQSHKGGFVIIKTDQNTKRVILRGNRFEVQLTWSQALALGSLLVAQSRHVEPAALPGRTYCPSTERDRR